MCQLYIYAHKKFSNKNYDLVLKNIADFRCIKFEENSVAREIT